MTNFIYLKYFVKKLAKTFLAVQRSIFVQFVDFENWHADLSDKTNLMSKINVGLIGTAQWYLQNGGPGKKKNPLLDAINPSIFVN